MSEIETFEVPIADDIVNIRAPKLDIDTNLLELSMYLNIPFQKLKNHLEEISRKHGGFSNFVKVTEEEWNSLNINQDDSSKVMEFYANTPNYMPELMIVGSTENKQKLTRFVLSYCIKEGVRRILDFGCGIGQDSIVASLNGLKATAADISGKTFDFAKWRFNKYSTNVNTVIIKNDSSLINKYDAITCFEVLQHVSDPEKTLEHFHEHLNDNGLLFITARFKGNYALALKKK